MVIVHCCLSNFYIDEYSYQENELVAQHVQQGHTVIVIASTEVFDSKGRLTYISECEYYGSDGAKVIRIPYRKWGPKRLMRKLRTYDGVLDLLRAFNPDIILFHGACAWELRTVARYKKANPAVKLYVDSHEDFFNSAKNWMSKWLLHFLYYRIVLKSCLANIDKVLCITLDTVSFINGFYGVPLKKVELFPLGGKIYDDKAYAETRFFLRKKLGVDSNNIVFVQSGKLDKTKQLLSALQAVREVNDPRLRFIIAGVMTSDVELLAKPLIESDPRVQYLGWLKPQELRNLLCASDVFVQPFGQTVTTQASLCCRCAIILQDVPSHRYFFCNNGFLVTNSKNLTAGFRYILENADRLDEMQSASVKFAEKNLNYVELARRVYR